MKKLWVSKWPEVAMLAGMTVWSCVAAENESSNSLSPAPSGEPTTAANKPFEASANNQDVQLASRTKDILKLVRAGISMDVIKDYVESAPAPGPLSSADIIALKQAAVPDDLISLLLKRSAGLTQAGGGTGASAATETPANTEAAGSAPASPSPNFQTARLDPESYEYWWYHYAYPRSLAFANERVLSSFSSPYSYTYAPFYGAGSAYGYYSYLYPYPPLPFPPYPFTSFTHPRRLNGR